MLITLAQLNPLVGDLKENANRIIEAIQKAKEGGSPLILFSELVLVGYPPLDLLFAHGFIDTVEHELERIRRACSNITAVIGTVRKNPKRHEKFLFNSACIIQDEKILGFYDKQLLPTYDVFDEKRYFEPGSAPFIFEINEQKIGVTICEDLWGHSKEVKESAYQKDPVAALQPNNLNFLLNLSASPYSIKKPACRERVAGAASFTLNCPVILCNQVGANDGLLFDGNSLIVDATGQVVFQAQCFKEEVVTIDINTPPKREIKNPTEILYSALVVGLRDYFHKQKFTKACLGLSGGIDSALVACLAVDALGKENVHMLFMPSRYTHEDSFEGAKIMAAFLSIDVQEISIEPLFESALKELPFKSERTQENLQARLRGLMLMALSNESGSLLLNTSNKSESAMGYATLYGDMCGAISVLGDLYKTQVYELAHFRKIPSFLIERVPTAELKHNQKDSDTLPEYSLLDLILADIIENTLSPEEISKKYNKSLDFTNDIFKKIFQNEYKRQQSPLILRVSEKALTPRVGRILPIVQRYY